MHLKLCFYICNSVAFNFLEFYLMKNKNIYDVIIIGGSYSGLAAAMALGRALRNVLLIDSVKPCNSQTPHSHNFLTQDGNTPKEISETAKSQVLNYKTVQFKEGLAVNASKADFGFTVKIDSGEIFNAKKLIFATGLKDLFPDIEGFSECWGISILHCPYCHGFEVKNEETGIISNGETGFEFARLISNWTTKLTVFTNGKSTFTKEQTEKLFSKNIQIVEKEILKVNHSKGKVESLEFSDSSKANVKAIYARPNFEQHCKIPENLGCEINEQGFLKVDAFQKTTVKNSYACGDNSAMRSLAVAVSTGTMAGVVANKDLIEEEF